MPLSEHEQHVLHQLEEALYEHDPAFAHRVRSETVYRHAGRYVKFSAIGLVAGLVVLVAFFTRSVVVGFMGFLVMLVSLVVLWTNLSRMGKAGFQELSEALGGKGPNDALRRAREWVDAHRRRGR